ncbi:MAG: thioredoxin domain-containing protein [Patescibacteria group bacterium]|jgi:protein-disulfide isomerase
MAIKKVEKNISSGIKTKEKISAHSPKLLIITGLVSLVGFVIIVLFGVSLYRGSALKTTESISDFSLVERGVIANDLFVSIKSYVPTVLDTDPIKGKADVPVTIIEYGDYGCTNCESMNKTVNKLLVEYPDEVNLVWKDVPTASSVNAAFAGRCAQSQGKFWEMHDLLLENNQFLNKGRISDLAKGLGLKLDEFNSCVDSGATASLVQEGIDQAAELGIDGTPYYFINDQEVSGMVSYSDLKSLIESELDK